MELTPTEKQIIIHALRDLRSTGKGKAWTAEIKAIIKKLKGAK